MANGGVEEGKEGAGVCVDGVNVGREIPRVVHHLDSIRGVVIVHRVHVGAKRLVMSGV
jgi:hypothetical protein